jgi:hypothetical protein
MQLSEAHKTYLIFRTVVALIIVPIVFVGFLVLFLVLPTPWYIPVGLVVIFLFVMTLMIIALVRLLKLNLEVKEIPTTPSREMAYTDEKVIGEVYNVMAPIRTTKGPGVIGYAEMTHSQNTLLFTNKRVLAVMVPVQGAGVAMGGIDYSSAHFLINKDGIVQQGRQMVATMTPAQILQFDKNNYAIAYSDIGKVKLRTFWGRGVLIWDAGGKKRMHFTFSDAKNLDLMRNIFNQYTPGKVK